MNTAFKEIVTFAHHFTAIIAGPTGSGKIQFVVELLKQGQFYKTKCQKNNLLLLNLAKKI